MAANTSKDGHLGGDFPLNTQNPADENTASIFLSPIYRLPNELIQTILIFAAAETNDPLPYSIRQKRFIPASKVCHRWHDICLETSVFWTIVDFSDGPPFSRTLLHLQRAKSQPLTLNVTPETRNSHIDNIMPILPSILPRVGRFHMDLKWPAWDKFFGCFPHSAEPSYSLYSVYLNPYHFSSRSLIANQNNRFIETFFKLIRRLDRLMLRETCLDILTPIRFDLSVLHLFWVHHAYLGPFFNFLGSCSALEELTMEECNDLRTGDIEDLPQVKCYFPKLKKLKFRNVSARIAIHFYTTAITTVLRSIETQKYDRRIPSLLVSFLERSFHDRTSSPFLDHVELRDWDDQHDEFFSGVPADAFHALHIAGSALRDEALLALTPGGDCNCDPKECSHYSCPNLSDLHLSGPSYCSHTSLVQMVLQRDKAEDPASHIRILDVQGCRPPENLINPHAEVKRAGVKVRAAVETVTWDWKLPSSLG
jgi:hypothetical protein